MNIWMARALWPATIGVAPDVPPKPVVELPFEYPALPVRSDVWMAS